MNDNTPNAKKIKIKNKLKKLFNQVCPTFFLVYLSFFFMIDQYVINTDLEFMIYFLFIFFEFLIVARYYDWSSWKEFENILFFLKLIIYTLILVLCLKLIFILIPYEPPVLRFILLIPIMWITIKLLPKFGIKSKNQFFKELDHEKLNTEIIRFIKRKYIINSIFRSIAIAAISFPILVVNFGECLGSLPMDTYHTILIIFLSIYAIIFILGVNLYYNFILFNFVPIFVQYFLYLSLCAWITFLYSGMYSGGIENMFFPPIFSLALAFYLEYKSGRIFLEVNLDLPMLPVKKKICSHCKEIISEEIINKTLDKEYIYCPHCRNRILKDELSDFDENRLRKEFQNVMDKITDSEKLP